MATKKATFDKLEFPGEHQTRRVPPDPEDMNEERAEWAEAALGEFANNTGQNLDVETDDAICDLVCDLAHYCDRNQLQLSKIIERSKFHYDEETNGRGKQFND